MREAKVTENKETEHFILVINTIHINPNRNRFRFFPLWIWFLLIALPLILCSMSAKGQENHASIPPSSLKQQLDFLLIVHADSGHVDVIKTLIAAGASPNASIWDGTTALMYASEKGHYSIARELIAHHANVNLANSQQFTALHYATINNHDSIAELLLLNGANVHPITQSNRSPLHYAAASGYPYLAHLLVEYGAHIDSADFQGNTPLLLSIYYGADLTAEMLLDQWADVNKADKNGYTPLMVAAQFNDTTLLALLLDYGANPLDRNLTGNTALSLAIENGANQAIELLILENAAKDKYSEKFSYADIAYRKGYPELATFLHNHGVPLKKRAYISRVDLYSGITFSGNDNYIILGTAIRISPVGMVIGSTLNLRPYHKSIVIETDYTDYQLFEIRNSISIYTLKNIYTNIIMRDVDFAIALGAMGIYSWGNYTIGNDPFKPYSYKRISPSIEFNFHKKNFMLSLGAHYNRMHHTKKQPLFMEIKAGYSFNLTNPKIALKQIDWL